MTPIRVDNSVLMRPRCGGHNLRHGEVRVLARSGEDQPGVCIRVSGGDGPFSATDVLEGQNVPAQGSWGAVNVQPAASGEFAGRRDDVGIAMVCEACHAVVATLQIVQHKGSTLVGWR